MRGARGSSSGRGRRNDAAGLAPFAELRPGPQVLADLREALLYLGPHGPVAVAAVAELVDSGSLVAADAFVEHARRTFGAPSRLRLEAVFSPRKELVRPGRGLFVSTLLREGGFDGGA